MNHGPSDELISAYFDRETPTADRLSLELEIQENPQLQKSLEEIQRLSSLLEEQPFHSAPEELLDSVMNSIREESRNRPTVRTSQGISPRLFAASLITTAAVMLLLSQWALISQSKSFQKSIAEQEQTQNDLIVQNSELNRRLGSFPAVRREGGDLPGNHPPLFLRGSEFSSTPFAKKKAFDYAHIVPSPILVTYDNEAFRKATPQEWFDRVSRKWSRVNLIRLPVSDIDKAQESFQSLVAEVGIFKTWGETYHSSEMAPIVKPGGYKAVFVQATHPQLKQIFENLQHVEYDTIFTALIIHNAIPFEGLDYESQYLIQNPMIGPRTPVIPFRKLKNEAKPQLPFRSSNRAVLENYAAQMKLYLPPQILDLKTPEPKQKNSLKNAEKKSPKSKDGYVRRKKDGRYVWLPRPIKTIFIFTSK